MVYVCGATGTNAYRVKNAVTAPFYDPVAFAALSDTVRATIDAYDVNDKIAADPFNPNSGEFSETWTKKAGGYSLDKIVNIDNGVYKCQKPALCGSTDPGSDKDGVWLAMTSERVPPSSIVQEVDYSEASLYYNRDLVISDSKIYRCIAENVVIDTDNTTNDCNSEKPSASAKAWFLTGQDPARDKSIVGGPFVAEADY